MVDISPIDSKIIGQRNESLILSLLFRYGQMSQSQLCKRAGIGTSTASTIVSRLRGKKLILEKQGRSTRRGPKPTILTINPNGHYVIGVEINPSYLFIGLFNFTGQSVDTIRLLLSNDHSLERVNELLSVNIPGLLSRSSIDRGKILGVGITLSGSVSESGIVQLSSPLGWKDVHLKECLAEHINLPIRIYSTKVRILAEIAKDSDLIDKNILYFNVANGVGSTLFLDGKILNGATGRLGEIGHTVVQENGPLCGCGHRGCLETQISGPALSGRIQQQMKGSKDSSILFQWISKQDKDTIPEKIISLWAKAVHQNDNYAMSLLEKIGRDISNTLCAAVNSFDPDTIILAGYVSQACSEYLIREIREKMKTSVYDNSLRKIQIIPARCGDDALINGVASAVLQEFFKTV